MKAPEIKVGIVSGEGITFTLNGIYSDPDGRASIEGQWTASAENNNIIIRRGDTIINAGREMLLSPDETRKSFFTLHAVTIGVNFHWQRDEDQSFRGSLKLIMEDGRLTAINILSLEDYLVSVISSEMSATSSEELLKAHAVISRSWLLAQTEKTKHLEKGAEKYQTHFQTPAELTRWYDREDHHNFDVCADDHCQRYQGITRASTPLVEKVIAETWGEVLVYDGRICDARYSKCCGGLSELFESAWEPVNHPYLKSIIDNPAAPEGFDTDLTVEENAQKWISGNPDAFCNTNDKQILTQVLNSYDQETNDFYRWKVRYTQKEISDLVRERSGIDFGLITDMIPVERGTSGRLVKLKLEGTLKSLVIGKELEIRKTLSKSHLYSSAFFAEKRIEGGETVFILHGAGWGHGVGFCQIGAAVMGARGYSYNQILLHYFSGAQLERRY